MLSVLDQGWAQMGAPRLPQLGVDAVQDVLTLQLDVVRSQCGSVVDFHVEKTLKPAIPGPLLGQQPPGEGRHRIYVFCHETLLRGLGQCHGRRHLGEQGHRERPGEDPSHPVLRDDALFRFDVIGEAQQDLHGVGQLLEACLCPRALLVRGGRRHISRNLPPSEVVGVVRQRSQEAHQEEDVHVREQGGTAAGPQSRHVLAVEPHVLSRRFFLLVVPTESEGPEVVQHALNLLPPGRSSLHVTRFETFVEQEVPELARLELAVAGHGRHAVDEEPVVRLPL